RRRSGRTIRQRSGVRERGKRFIAPAALPPRAPPRSRLEPPPYPGKRAPHTRTSTAHLIHRLRACGRSPWAFHVASGEVSSCTIACGSVPVPRGEELGGATERP